MLCESDIRNREVLEWRGVHLFHFLGSTCSQKTRIFLRLKGISWTSHHVNLARKEQLKEEFLGINPRGLVPVLIHDGKVIIESNDILTYLDAEFSGPKLIPTDQADEVSALLKEEDDLHLHIRALTLRFVVPSFLAKRTESEIIAYESTGSGTVDGIPDVSKEREAGFWRNLNASGGITDSQVRDAFARFKSTLDDFEAVLDERPYLMGAQCSLADIAWYIYGRRLIDAGYPLAELHPNVFSWFTKLHADENFRREVPAGSAMSLVTVLLHGVQKLRRSTLMDVVRQDPQRLFNQRQIR